jgi:hypothetical protein
MNLQLTESEVLNIFNIVKISSPFLKGLYTDNNPVIAILGGQPASGKSIMTNSFKNSFPERKFLTINGDLYRAYHPNHDDIIRCNTMQYSAITQNFSNIFTQELLTIALENKFNVIVEGTMRNPSVPINTAKRFKENEFEVHACVIAAHPTLTELGVYKRYQEQVWKFGSGRLADVNVHNEAVTGLLNSVNLLYQNKLVDFIHIYSYLAEKKVISFFLSEDGNWNTEVSPSAYIEEERNLQQSNKDVLIREIKSGIEILKTVDSSLKNEVSKCIEELSSYLSANSSEKNLINNNK